MDLSSEGVSKGFKPDAQWTLLDLHFRKISLADTLTVGWKGEGTVGSNKEADPKASMRDSKVSC